MPRTRSRINQETVHVAIRDHPRIVGAERAFQQIPQTSSTSIQNRWLPLPAGPLRAQSILPAKRTLESPALIQIDASRSQSNLSRLLSLSIHIGPTLGQDAGALQLTPSGAAAASLFSTYLARPLRQAAPAVRSLLSGSSMPPDTSASSAATAFLFVYLSQSGIQGLFCDLFLEAGALESIKGTPLSISEVQSQLYNQQLKLVKLVYYGPNALSE